MPQAKYSNTSSLPISIAVFLATDTYDHDDAADHISATSLLKPVRQLILASRLPVGQAVFDLEDNLANRMGSAIHDSIERAWKTNYRQALRDIGYPEKVIDRIVINPDPDLPGIKDGSILPVYLEQRTSKRIGKYRISGKFDFVGDGRLEDFKTASVYSWIHGSNDEKHALQGSIYRWLNPKIITKDEMAIQYIFTDWSKVKALSDTKYPQKRHQQKLFKLKSVEETEAFIQNKLHQLDRFWLAPEMNLPLCSDEDLWRSEPVFKYYKNPQKMSRSTKNYDTRQDAYLRLAQEGGQGVVVEQPGQVKACLYCPAFSLCGQKDDLIAKGELVLS